MVASLASTLPRLDPAGESVSTDQPGLALDGAVVHHENLERLAWALLNFVAEQSFPSITP